MVPGQVPPDMSLSIPDRGIKNEPTDKEKYKKKQIMFSKLKILNQLGPIINSFA
jgi:hypothetical protein